MKWFYTYVIKSELDGSWYTGYTQDLAKRLVEHNSGKCITTKRKKPYYLIYAEACLSQKDALSREKYLKTGMGKRYIRNRLKDYLHS